ncbi:MAG: ferric reductase-like transmembrane domain-containing protein [Pseudomonadota bacterium]
MIGSKLKAPLIWGGLALLMVVPVVAAGFSPYLSYRNAVYIIAGFAGIVGLALLLPQPLLAARYLPGLSPPQATRLHRWVGSGLVLCVALHVGGLYLTSPMDTLDVLLLRAPTPFAVHGFLAMWGVILTALLVLFRRRLPLSPRLWRWAHNALALGVVITTYIHAARIEGAMSPLTKTILLVAVLLANLVVILDLRLVRPILTRHRLTGRS